MLHRLTSAFSAIHRKVDFAISGANCVHTVMLPVLADCVYGTDKIVEYKEFSIIGAPEIYHFFDNSPTANIADFTHTMAAWNIRYPSDYYVRLYKVHDKLLKMCCLNDGRIHFEICDIFNKKID